MHVERFEMALCSISSVGSGLLARSPPPPPDIDTGLEVLHRMDTGDISGGSIVNHAPSGTSSTVNGTFTVLTADKKVGTASIRNTTNDDTQRITRQFTPPAQSVGWNLSFWMKSITNNTSGIFLSFNIGTGGATARITLRTIAVNNTFRMEIFDSVPNQNTRFNLYTFTPNTWHHVSINFHDTTPYYTTYVDGVLQAFSADSGVRIQPRSEAYSLFLFGNAGLTPTQPTQIWACDDFRIYSRQLSAADIGALVALGT